MIKPALLLSLGVIACGVDNSQVRLRTAIDLHQESFHRCYAQALVNDAGLEGTVRVVVRVPQNSDRIDMVEPSGESQLTNPNLMSPLHHCIQRSLMGTSIGSTPIQGDLYVQYAFQFAPNGTQIQPIDMQPAQPGVKFDVNANGEVNANADVGSGPIRATVTVDPRRRSVVGNVGLQ